MRTTIMRTQRKFCPSLVEGRLEERLALSTVQATVATSSVVKAAATSANVWTFEYYNINQPRQLYVVPSLTTRDNVVKVAESFLKANQANGWRISRLINRSDNTSVPISPPGGSTGGNTGGNTGTGNQTGVGISYPVTQVFYRRPGSNPNDSRSYTYYGTVSQTRVGGYKLIEYDNRIINSRLIPFHQSSVVRFNTSDATIWVSRGGVVSQVPSRGTSLQWD